MKKNYQQPQVSLIAVRLSNVVCVSVISTPTDGGQGD